MQTVRYLQSTPELDRQELDWWQKFAEVEEKYCSVQTPAIQRFLRKHYIQQLLSAVSPGSRVAELGCGAGWLSILLAQSGMADVVGIDFSPAQIQLANEAARRAGVGQKVHFRVATPTELNSTTDRYDLLIMHGFLHHLSVAEIQAAFSTARHLLADGGRLFIFEPVMYKQSSPTDGQTMRWLKWMKMLKLRIERMGLRKIGPQEQQLRDLIAQREVGVPPFGPSPKETPFLPNEIPDLLNGGFTIQRRERVLLYSYLIAQELLLAELTYPRLVKLVWWPILWFTRFKEHRILHRPTPPPNLWVLELFECIPVK